MSNEDTCPTCAEQYCGRYCTDCGRDTRLPPELSEMQRLDDDDVEEMTHRHRLQGAKETAMNKEQEALEREHNELLLLRDWRETRVALDLLEGYRYKDVIAAVARLEHKAARAVTRFYATGKCERVDLGIIRVDATAPNKTISNEHERIVVKAMQDAISPPPKAEGKQ